MKIIFLDIDGVLILWDMYAPSGYIEPNCTEDGFKKSCVSDLNQLLNETNAKIVFSTSWINRYTVDELTGILIKNSVECKGKVLGKVKGCRELSCSDRGERIKDYLVCNGMIDELGSYTIDFVILDDEFDMLGMEDRFVKCNAKTGFNRECLNKALKILKMWDLYE